jgi:hypothetical protein
MADKLTFILLRSAEGDNSPEWLQTIALARRVVDSVLLSDEGSQGTLTLRDVESLQEDMRSATNTLQHADKEKILQTLFELQRSIAAGNDVTDIAEPVEVAVSEPEQPGEAGATELTAAQRQMLEKLKNVPFGTWFEFHKPGEPAKRAKLSWRSTVTEKFMFVDQMGVKAAVVCMHELADCMLNGTTRILTKEKKPFVDRALSAIHRMLDHAA